MAANSGAGWGNTIRVPTGGVQTSWEAHASAGDGQRWRDDAAVGRDNKAGD